MIKPDKEGEMVLYEDHVEIVKELNQRFDRCVSENSQDIVDLCKELAGFRRKYGIEMPPNATGMIISTA